jgi:hypothetical protein
MYSIHPATIEAYEMGCPLSEADWEVVRGWRGSTAIKNTVIYPTDSRRYLGRMLRPYRVARAAGVPLRHSFSYSGPGRRKGLFGRTQTYFAGHLRVARDRVPP